MTIKEIADEIGRIIDGDSPKETKALDIRLVFERDALNFHQKQEVMKTVGLEKWTKFLESLGGYALGDQFQKDLKERRQARG